MSFLVQVAESGMFHTGEPGKTRIDTAKEAKLYDVLVWASMKSDYDNSMRLYYKLLEEKKK